MRNPAPVATFLKSRRVFSYVLDREQDLDFCFTMKFPHVSCELFARTRAYLSTSRAVARVYPVDSACRRQHLHRYPAKVAS